MVGRTTSLNLDPHVVAVLEPRILVGRAVKRQRRSSQDDGPGLESDSLRHLGDEFRLYYSRTSVTWRHLSREREIGTHN